MVFDTLSKTLEMTVRSRLVGAANNGICEQAVEAPPPPKSPSLSAYGKLRMASSDRFREIN
jgi:hypothetical protein